MKRILITALLVLTLGTTAAAQETIGHPGNGYPVAREVYTLLHDAGFGDVPVAGILGNMMAEVGGQTLDLQPCIYALGGRYYGLCMWALQYSPDVSGSDVAGQIDFLVETIDRNMRCFGGSLEAYKAIDEPGAAARYFCLHYERGGGAWQRARNAERAMGWINGMERGDDGFGSSGR